MRGLVKSTYIEWLKSDKQMITIVSLICLFMYVITPLKLFMKEFGGEPLQFLEPFLTFLGNGFCIPIFTVAFLVTIIDFPDTSSGSVFIICRLGRKRWYRAQIGFLILSIVTFVALLFMFSIVLTVQSAFLTNSWSNVMLNIQMELHRQLKTLYPLATIDLSIINHFRPTTALVYSVLLTVMNLLLHGQLQILLTIKFNRMIGIFSSILLLGGGLVSWAASSNIRWLFPFAHSTIGWHYDKLFEKTEMPLAASFAYIIAANILLYVLTQWAIRKKQFYFGDNEND